MTLPSFPSSLKINVWELPTQLETQEGFKNRFLEDSTTHQNEDALLEALLLFAMFADCFAIKDLHIFKTIQIKLV